MSTPIPSLTATELVNDLSDSVWSQGRLDMVPTYIHPDYTMLDERGEVRVRGRDEFAEAVSVYREMFEDLRMRSTHLVQGCDSVAYRWELTGSLHDIQQLGPGLRIMVRDVPELRLISIRGISIARLSDGMVVEEICDTDASAFDQQMGWWK